MKTWMKVLLGIAAGIAVLLGFVFWLTGDLAKTGDDFFAAVEQGNTEQAYDMLADEFKAGANQADFDDYLKTTGLAEAQSVSWTSREFSGDVGNLKGSVTTKSGSKIPLSMELVETEDGWRIYRVNMRSAGFNGGSGQPAMPSVAEQMALVNGTTNVFSDAVIAKDMALFHRSLSPTWRKQITPQKLEDTFDSLYQFQGKMAILKDTRPQLQKKSFINDDGVLVIEGFYDAEETAAIFRYKYIFEGLKWRQLGHKIELVR